MSQNPQDNQSYPLRLPNYRFLHQGRYHPYPTFNRQQGASSSETGDVEIAEAPIIPTDDSAEAGPSTQQGPSATSEPQPTQSADERGNAQSDLANLDVIVDEMEGTTSGSNEPRDSAASVVARLCFSNEGSGFSGEEQDPILRETSSFIPTLLTPPNGMPVNVRFPALLEQPPVDRVRKRGLVYPKLAQSKGSGDRMNSPDLFWGTRGVSAVPQGPDPREAVPRRRSIHLPKPAVTLSGILRLCIREKTRRTSQLWCFEPRYNNMGTSDSTSTTRPPPRSGTYHLCRSLGSSVLEGRWMMRGAHSRCTVTPATIEVEFEDDGLFGVPSSAHSPSTPISSYSSETSTSDRDSENSSVVI